MDTHGDDSGYLTVDLGGRDTQDQRGAEQQHSGDQGYMPMALDPVRVVIQPIR